MSEHGEETHLEQDAPGHAESGHEAAPGHEAQGHDAAPGHEGTQAVEGHEGGHGGEHEGGGIPELQNALDYILVAKTGNDLHTVHTTEVFNKGAGIMSLTWLDIINVSYSFLAIFILVTVALLVKAKPRKIPTGFQCLMELLVKWMDNYTEAILGKKLARPFVPLVGTLFLYILTMNYMGLIPFFKAPVALNINVPLSMAICVLFVVQYHGLRQNGPVKYFKHFTGDPSGMVPLDVFLMPLNFILHVIGELAKPLSLTLRLFGNITGEDVVVAAFVGLTVGVAFVPIPLQALFYPLAMLFGFIQALVFATLSAVYLLLMSAHEEHH